MGTTHIDENGVIRYRRAKSVSRAEDIQKEEAKVRRSQPDKPCHRPRDSLFSWSSGFDNFTGLVNWGFLLLTVGGVRLLLENLIKYGVRVDPQQWFIVLTGQHEGGSEHPSIILLMYSIVPVLLCLLIEKGLSVEIIAHGPGMFAHVVNLVVMVLIPMVIIHIKNTEFSLIGASTVCTMYSLLFFKLWSYVQVNLWCRIKRNNSSSKTHLRRQSLSYHNFSSTENVANGSASSKNKQEVGLVQYPDNLNLHDIIYFIFAPTLCYELNFPRTNRIRKRWTKRWHRREDSGKESGKVGKCDGGPKSSDLADIFLLAVSLFPFLNLIGELLHFADRNYYCDWWNANNIDTFWRTWNMPVHRWAVRHLYIPLVEQGYGKTFASTVVFFISAFFHEYLVSVPLRTFKIWAFMGMMGQIPLSFVSRVMERKMGPRWGNIVVWASLILGQPLCIMMYYHDYVITHMGKELIEMYGHL
uniref:O-acyltransferase n=1 Tax=Timema tahoe TaxID=61484 RepID=A0A7R9IFE2_9NEOP|nr:unnamed protein product [Timema tahoe]